MSKKSDEQTTPKWLFDILNDIFKFDLDAAATKQNALCEMYYDQHANGLERRWGNSTWCNPPYSRGSILPFVKKAENEYLFHGINSLLLLPGDFSTNWFFEAYQKCTGIFGYNGRLKFNGSKDCAKFGSALVLYGYNKTKFLKLEKSLRGMWLKTPYYLYKEQINVGKQLVSEGIV